MPHFREWLWIEKRKKWGRTNRCKYQLKSEKRSEEWVWKARERSQLIALAERVEIVIKLVEGSAERNEMSLKRYLLFRHEVWRTEWKWAQKNAVITIIFNWICVILLLQAIDYFVFMQHSSILSYRSPRKPLSIFEYSDQGLSVYGIFLLKKILFAIELFSNENKFWMFYTYRFQEFFSEV